MTDTTAYFDGEELAQRGPTMVDVICKKADRRVAFVRIDPTRGPMFWWRLQGLRSDLMRGEKELVGRRLKPLSDLQVLPLDEHVGRIELAVGCPKCGYMSVDLVALRSAAREAMKGATRIRFML